MLPGENTRAWQPAEPAYITGGPSLVEEVDSQLRNVKSFISSRNCDRHRYSHFPDVPFVPVRSKHQQPKTDGFCWMAPVPRRSSEQRKINQQRTAISLFHMEHPHRFVHWLSDIDWLRRICLRRSQWIVKSQNRNACCAQCSWWKHRVVPNFLQNRHGSNWKQRYNLRKPGRHPFLLFRQPFPQRNQRSEWNCREELHYLRALWLADHNERESYNHLFHRRYGRSDRPISSKGNCQLECRLERPFARLRVRRQASCRYRRHCLLSVRCLQIWCCFAQPQ